MKIKYCTNRYEDREKSSPDVSADLHYLSGIINPALSSFHGYFHRPYLLALQSSKDFKDANIIIPKQEIAEVDSHNHVILQFTDLILGSIAFRLNDKHKEKIPGTRFRGKKTLAKEKLYKHILSEICKIRPNFNIGISTSEKGDKKNRWNYPYMHWLFVPKESEVDKSIKKG